MVFCATDLGLGSCWVRQFDLELAAKALELEERYELVALLPVGFPANQPPMRPRIPLDEMLLKTC